MICHGFCSDDIDPKCAIITNENNTMIVAENQCKLDYKKCIANITNESNIRDVNCRTGEFLDYKPE